MLKIGLSAVPHKFTVGTILYVTTTPKKKSVDQIVVRLIETIGI